MKAKVKKAQREKESRLVVQHVQMCAVDAENGFSVYLRPFKL
jgi:hypothetical protein